MTDDDLTKAVEAIQAKIGGMDAFGTKIRFDFDDGSAIFLDGTSEPPAAAANGEGDADCTITAAAEVFQEMMEGELDPTAAFMTGKIKIDGDMSAAMSVAKVFG